MLRNAFGEVDESSTFGNYWHSTISQYLFYLPLDDYHMAQKLSDDDKKIILDAVLCLYPHQDEIPQIIEINFRLIRSVEDEEAAEVESVDKINHEFVKEQIDKCREKIQKEDYDGAISSAGSLLEGVFNDIYEVCTGKPIEKIDDLKVGYKQIKDLIKLSDEQYSSENVKGLMRGLTSVVSSLDALRNQMGDRHVRLTRPWRRHAKICVNSAVALTDFLYETLEFQKEKIENLYSNLIEILDSEKRFLKKEELFSDEVVMKHLNQYDVFSKSEVKKYFINNFSISRYRDSDIFFSAMEVFLIF